MSDFNVIIRKLFVMFASGFRYVTPPQQISAFNKRVVPEVDSDNGCSWVKPEESVNVVFGDNVSSKFSI